MQFVNSMDCKKLLFGTYWNYAIFAKPICKGSDCRWCTYYCTYVKIITCIHSLCHLQNYCIYKYKTKQPITAVRTVLKTKV